MKFKQNRPCFLFAVLWVLLTSCSLNSEDEQRIRDARQSSNRALADHDSASLAQTLTWDYNLVTSRNVASNLRSVMLERIQSDWNAKPDLVYKRTPGRIEVFAGWRMASESGTWEGSWTEANGEKIRLTGSYYAKWHKENDQWRIRAEVFTPLQCKGSSYCVDGPLGNR